MSDFRQRYDEMGRDPSRSLRALVAATAGVVGVDFFRALVRSLAEVQGYRYCFVTECLPAERVATLAFWNGEQLLDRYEYSLAGTPCEVVFDSGEPVVYGEEVQCLFPLDKDLVDLSAQSYAAVPFRGADGRVVGHLAVLDVRPFDPRGPDLALLALFGARAGAELERQRAEEREHELQAKMLHGQKLESLGLLAGGIAHDFNNLLTSILGNLNLALTQMPTASPWRRYLEEAENAGERCAELTHLMLAYAGKAQRKVVTVDLAELVQEMTGLLRSSISKKVRLDLDLPPDLPVVEADPTQLRQVVMNLITNASEALEDRPGTVRLALRLEKRPAPRPAVPEADGDAGGQENWLPDADEAEEATAETGHVLCLEVTDDGIGMEPAVRERLFDPFFSTKATGRGLGMAAVLGIVRSHRGAIRVASEAGQGTSFEVLLPVSEVAVAAAARSAAGPPAAAAARVRQAPAAGEPPAERVERQGTFLVVDDEEMIRQLLRRLLERLGFDVVEAADGRQALDLFGREGGRFRAVVLDLKMPEVDGLEALGELRRRQRDLPVLLISGYPEFEASEDLPQDPLTTFLQKPFRPRDLETALGRLRVA